MVSDRGLNQLDVAFGVQDFHDLVLVEGNGVRGYIQRIRYFLHRLSWKLPNWSCAGRFLDFPSRLQR
jgi:hypothetical protein